MFWGPFLWRYPVPFRRVTLPVESILACIHMRKKVDLFSRANSAHACVGCLALTMLFRLGEPKCLYQRKVGPARGGDPPLA